MRLHAFSTLILALAGATSSFAALAGRDGAPKKLQIKRAGKSLEATVTVRDLTKR